METFNQNLFYIDQYIKKSYIFQMFKNIIFEIIIERIILLYPMMHDELSLCDWNKAIQIRNKFYIR